MNLPPRHRAAHRRSVGSSRAGQRRRRSGSFRGPPTSAARLHSDPVPLAMTCERAPTRSRVAARTCGGGGPLRYLWTRVSGDVAIEASVRFTDSQPDSGEAQPHRKAVLVVRRDARLERGVRRRRTPRRRPHLAAVARCARARRRTRCSPRSSGPARLRIEKRGEYVSMYVADGAEPLRPSGGATKLALGPTFYVGLGVTAHDSTRIETATFSDVRVERLAPVPDTGAVISTIETISLRSKDRRVAAVVEERAPVTSVWWYPDGSRTLYFREAFDQLGRVQADLPGEPPSRGRLAVPQRVASGMTSAPSCVTADTGRRWTLRDDASHSSPGLFLTLVEATSAADRAGDAGPSRPPRAMVCRRLGLRVRQREGRPDLSRSRALARSRPDHVERPQRRSRAVTRRPCRVLQLRSLRPAAALAYECRRLRARAAHPRRRGQHAPISVARWSLGRLPDVRRSRTQSGATARRAPAPALARRRQDRRAGEVARRELQPGRISLVARWPVPRLRELPARAALTRSRARVSGEIACGAPDERRALSSSVQTASDQWSTPHHFIRRRRRARMRRRATLAALAAALLIASSLRAQQTTPASNASNAAPAGDTKEWTTADDHRQMMEQLGITALRPGPSGNEQEPNHANYDESKANPFPKLPDAADAEERPARSRARGSGRGGAPRSSRTSSARCSAEFRRTCRKVTWTVTATDTGTIGGRSRHRQAARRPRRQLGVSRHHRRHSR